MDLTKLSTTQKNDILKELNNPQVLTGFLIGRKILLNIDNKKQLVSFNDVFKFLNDLSKSSNSVVKKQVFDVYDIISKKDQETKNPNSLTRLFNFTFNKQSINENTLENLRDVLTVKNVEEGQVAFKALPFKERILLDIDDFRKKHPQTSKPLNKLHEYFSTNKNFIDKGHGSIDINFGKEDYLNEDGQPWSSSEKETFIDFFIQTFEKIEQNMKDEQLEEFDIEKVRKKNPKITNDNSLNLPDYMNAYRTKELIFYQHERNICLALLEAFRSPNDASLDTAAFKNSAPRIYSFYERHSDLGKSSDHKVL